MPIMRSTIFHGRISGNRLVFSGLVLKSQRPIEKWAIFRFMEIWPHSRTLWYLMWMTMATMGLMNGTTIGCFQSRCCSQSPSWLPLVLYTLLEFSGKWLSIILNSTFKQDMDTFLPKPLEGSSSVLVMRWLASLCSLFSWRISAIWWQMGSDGCTGKSSEFDLKRPLMALNEPEMGNWLKEI